jgi:predicted transcriptional regulator of viral defense system
MSFIKNLIKSNKNKQTVFRFSDLSQIVEGYTGPKLRSALKYALNKGDIFRISQGIYCLSKDYSRFEFANKYRSPSYISLYSVLKKEGIVFQPYSTIYIVSNRSKEIELDGQKYIYRKIKDNVLLNPLGIKNEDGVHVANIERAICDKLYLDGDEYFDNLRNVDWNLMTEINTKVYGKNKLILNFINKNNK